MAVQTVNNVIMVRAVGTAGSDETFTMNRAGIAYDMVVILTGASGAGTVTLENGAGNPISGALNPGGTDTRAVRSLTGDPWTTNKALVVGSVLTFTATNAIDYEAYCYIYPTPGATG
jgi:hypothetical protein